jgi:hypothetical protein
MVIQRAIVARRISVNDNNDVPAATINDFVLSVIRLLGCLDVKNRNRDSVVFVGRKSCRRRDVVRVHIFREAISSGAEERRCQYCRGVACHEEYRRRRLTRHKISDDWRERACLQVRGCSYHKLDIGTASRSLHRLVRPPRMSTSRLRSPRS